MILIKNNFSIHSNIIKQDIFFRPLKLIFIIPSCQWDYYSLAGYIRNLVTPFTIEEFGLLFRKEKYFSYLIKKRTNDIIFNII